ncbi:MAG TPA: efflux RND transporter permease subunit, partial [Candidatus Limnocylindrales bacterium]|nr:efflux RND transporter permease subunit [Candidatus Limnocylindrales bacterium]
HRSVVILLSFALFVAGLSAWGSLKQELLPDVDFPVITIVAPYPGAGATDVTAQVAEPIERAVQGTANLAQMQSTSANSIALIVAQFEFGTDVDAAQAEIEENIAALGLPDSVDPTVQALNINASPVIIASVSATSEEGLDEAARIATEEIVPRLQAVSGVATVDLTGGLESQVFITVDPTAMAEAGIGQQQLLGVLQANEITVPSGQLNSDGQRIPVSTIGELTSVDQISQLIVGVRQTPAIPGATPDPNAIPIPVTIGDIATVEIAEVATTGYARTDGQPSLTLTVTKTSDANTVLVANEVEEVLAEIGAEHPDSITVATVSDLSVFIVESQEGLVREGGLGAIFAIITIFLFLFSLRSTLVAAISIPLSVLSALVLMQVADISLNVMTLGGLAVAVGRVVDDAIVVLENIYRHRAMGQDRLTASIEGPKEVARAITSSTLTTILVFLPIGFVGGLVSQLFLPFALTVTFALLASLIVALTVVPVLAYLFINKVPSNVDADGEPKNSFWIRVYTPLITGALRNRATKFAVLGVSALLFVASLTLVGQLPTQFINTGSEKILQVTLVPPAGASSQAVLDQAIEAETILIAQEDVETVQTSVPGEGDAGFNTVIAALQGQPANSATITVRLDPTVDLGEATTSLSTALDPVKTDGYEINVSEAAGFTSNNLNVIVSGSNTEDVAVATEAVMGAIDDRSDLANLSSDLAAATPEIQVRVDPNLAATTGSTAAQIAGEIRGLLTSTSVTTLTLDDVGAAELIVRSDPDVVTSVDELSQVMVGTVRRVPLSQVAEVEQVDVQGSITRIDGAPAAQITAEITSADTGAVSADIKETIDGLVAAGSIPAGVDVRLAGVTEQQNEAFGGLFTSMAVAILLVYVMLVLTFNSLITPFIIMFSLPLATIGAFPALFITGRPIGVSALIGFLMLIGIVVTNAIVLLDLVERLRADGHSVRDALIEGGRTRVRPILMTAFATILALIPLAAGFNEGSIIAAELGTVVIGGLFSSTFLTLLVVPVVYSLVEGGKTGLSRRMRREPKPVVPDAEAAPVGG